MDGKLVNSLAQQLSAASYSQIVFAIGVWLGKIGAGRERPESISQKGGKEMKVGFIGLKRMGAGMAANLLKAGNDVTVYNRTRSKVEARVAQGAKAATSVSETCLGDVVMTMLANDDAVESVVFGDDGIIGNLRQGAIHVSSSTISVTPSERLEAAHAKAGQRFVAAPVFGRPDAAAAGQLVVAAAGAPGAVKAVSPLLDAIGKSTFVAAETAKIANLVKLSGNFLLASVIRIARRGHGAGWQGRRRPAAIYQLPDLDAVRRPGLQDLWRVDRR